MRTAIVAVNLPALVVRDRMVVPDFRSGRHEWWASMRQARLRV
jgi:hypothetical protein